MSLLIPCLRIAFLELISVISILRRVTLTSTTFMWSFSWALYVKYYMALDWFPDDIDMAVWWYNFLCCWQESVPLIAVLVIWYIHLVVEQSPLHMSIILRTWISRLLLLKAICRCFTNRYILGFRATKIYLNRSKQ